MLLLSRLRFVLASGVSKVEVTFDRLALEGTKQIRPHSIGTSGSVTADFAFGKQGRRRDCLRRNRNIGEDHPANV